MEAHRALAAWFERPMSTARLDLAKSRTVNRAVMMRQEIGGSYIFASGGATRVASLWLALVAAASCAPQPVAAEVAEAPQVMVITNDLALEPGATLRVRLVVRGSHLTIDGRGATLIGPCQVGDPASLEKAGVGVLIEGASGVTVRHIRARGFATGLVVREAQAIVVEQSDFSDNYHHPAHGWGELPPRGGIVFENAHFCVVRNSRANRVWDGLHLVDANDNWVISNDFSECSNTCA